MSDKSIYWYDFETFGKDPRRNRASQFAGIRTDEDLNIISEPLVFYCTPADDFLPDPMACLITGISPQKALADGVCEMEFIKRIHEEFSQPGTCVAGYNSIRFDDELTRQLLYRNFYDPYEREWKNGNSRWDIIDMARLCAATRPEGIVWPLCPHPTNNNGIIVYDLREDPESWARLSVEEIRRRIFTARDSMEEGVERIGLKTIHINKCPVVASPAVLPAQSAEQFGVDLGKCKSHWNYLQGNKDIVSKVAEVFSQESSHKETDPDYMIYSGGFFSDSDKNLMSMIRSTSAQDLARLDLPFRDARLGAMLQRYRARNFRDTLNNQELTEWNQFRRDRLFSSEALASYEQSYAQAKAKAGDSKQELFKSLDDYVAAIRVVDAAAT